MRIKYRLLDCNIFCFGLALFGGMSSMAFHISFFFLQEVSRNSMTFLARVWINISIENQSPTELKAL